MSSAVLTLVLCRTVRPDVPRSDALWRGLRARGGYVRRHDEINPVEQRRIDQHPGNDA